MREHDIACGALAVMKGGKLVLSRGYGYAKRDGSRKVEADDPFRLASVSKPITAAAVRALVKAGKVKLDTPAFVFLGTKPLAGQKMDDRLKAITVGHLLAHKGGWDSSVGPIHDVMFQPLRVSKGLKKPLPLAADDYVRFMAGQPLQFAPGSKEAYSNFGYCVLGRVIEKASGQPNEPYYRDLAVGLNLQTGKGQVPFPDGGYLLEAMDSHGGLIASAPDLARFLDAYLIDGRPRQGGVALSSFFGSLGGTFAMGRQRIDGVYFAALFNQRYSPDGRNPKRIERMLDDAVKAVKKWP
jgi:CubicO group peptidase (beta-lactamase class C family)